MLSSSRRIPKNYSNITGKIPSSKSPHPISFESKLERDYYYLFEFDDEIVSIQDQPVTIKFLCDDKPMKYTPDFLIEFKSGQKILGEIKYKSKLKKDFEKLRPKFEAAIEYCKQFEEMQFKIFTNACKKIGIYSENVIFLLNYDKIDPKYKKIIMDNLQTPKTVQEILDAFHGDLETKSEIIRTLWAMVRHKSINADLYEKLTNDSTLELNV